MFGTSRSFTSLPAPFAWPVLVRTAWGAPKASRFGRGAICHLGTRSPPSLSPPFRRRRVPLCPGGRVVRRGRAAPRGPRYDCHRRILLCLLGGLLDGPPLEQRQGAGLDTRSAADARHSPVKLGATGSEPRRTPRPTPAGDPGKRSVRLLRSTGTGTDAEPRGAAPGMWTAPCWALESSDKRFGAGFAASWALVVPTTMLALTSRLPGRLSLCGTVRQGRSAGRVRGGRRGLFLWAGEFVSLKPGGCG